MLFRQVRSYFTSLNLLWLFSLIIFVASCEQEDNRNEIIFPEFAVASADMIVKTKRTSADLFYPENEATHYKLNTIINRCDINDFVSYYELLGYKYAPEQSFFIKGISDNRSVAITFIIMTATVPSAVGTVVMTCVDIDADFWISPVVFTMSQPAKDAGFQQIDDGLWAKTFNQSDFQKSSTRISIEQLKDYYDCLYSKLPGQVARCAVACVIASVGYIECVSVCTGAQMIGQAIDCLVQSSLSSRKDKKQE